MLMNEQFMSLMGHDGKLLRGFESYFHAHLLIPGEVVEEDGKVWKVCTYNALVLKIWARFSKVGTHPAGIIQPLVQDSLGNESGLKMYGTLE